jgi:hypothetical protein
MHPCLNPASMSPPYPHTHTHSPLTPHTHSPHTQSLYKQFADTLKGLGVEAVATVGAPFDPEVHDAIMREPSDEVPDGTVLMEFRKGFRMGERLLRPAMVKVGLGVEGGGCCVWEWLGWVWGGGTGG